jgi:membrane protease YdiL (CAAX protease family)
MFFRGFLFSVIERKLNSKSAIILSSIAFALGHVNRPLHVPLMLIYGFVLGYSFYRLRNIASLIIAHVFSNLIYSSQGFGHRSLRYNKGNHF